MLNFVLSSNIYLSVFFMLSLLIIAFILRIRPELSGENDAIFLAPCSLYSFIIFLHGWRLDPILMLAQMLLVITLLLIIWEIFNIRYGIKKVDELLTRAENEVDDLQIERKEIIYYHRKFKEERKQFEKRLEQFEKEKELFEEVKQVYEKEWEN